MNKLSHKNLDNAWVDKTAYAKANEYPINVDSTHVWDYSLIDVNDLCAYVITIAKETYKALGKGHPLTVYQLKLFNELTKDGLRLQIDKTLSESLLDNGMMVKEERNIIVINDVLVVEYLSSMITNSYFENRLMKNLQSNNYAMGLLVNIQEEKNNVEIREVHQDYIAH